VTLSVQFLPSPRLQPYVHSYRVQTKEALVSYQVHPSIFHVMGIQVTGSLVAYTSNITNPLHRFGITGLQTTSKMFSGNTNTSTVLIYFKPNGLRRFLNASPREIQGLSVGMNNFCSESILSTLYNQIDSKPTRAVAIVDQFLCQIFREEVDDDPLVNHGLNSILKSHGSLHIESVYRELFLSPRQFERRFSDNVGISPKQFASIVRFQETLRRLRGVQNLTEVAQSLGYHDQSHFIKDFKRISGISPGRFVEDEELGTP
jgi:AraC-like DNA-binding protein